MGPKSYQKLNLKKMTKFLLSKKSRDLSIASKTSDDQKFKFIFLSPIICFSETPSLGTLLKTFKPI